MHTRPASGSRNIRTRDIRRTLRVSLLVLTFPVALAGVAQALPLVVASSSLPDRTVGIAHSDSVVAADGVRPWTWTIVAGGLPAGLALDGVTGAIAGTPSATGTSDFIVSVTDAAGDTATRALALTIVGVPAPVTDLAATRLGSGNDADGTARVQIAFTPTPFGVAAKVYRAPFGGYPRYDDAGGIEPPTPSHPPGPPWVLTAVTASGQTDEPATRDAWSYVVFLENSAGASSAVSNKTSPTTNYALGDVANGITPGAGDNQVSDLDISLLGAHYGISGGAITAAGVSYLDVGPTADFTLASRPFTDNRIDFEDLIVFATTYGAVSSPASIVARANEVVRSARAMERLSLDAPSRVEAGTAFAAVVRLEAHGRIQGLSAELEWDPGVVEPVSASGSEWLAGQKGVLLSPRPGIVDVALLGARATGLAGEGELATVAFRARSAGDPAIRFGRVLARDGANRPIPGSALDVPSLTAKPARTLLLSPAPNPSGAHTTLGFALAHPSEVDLAVFSVDGRRVRTLARGPFAAGTHRFTWAGDDEERRAARPGVYYVQLAVRGGPSFARAIVHLH